MGESWIELPDDDLVAMLSENDPEYEPSVSSESDKSIDEMVSPQLEVVIVKKRSHHDDCAICLEPFRFRQHARRTPCSHLFHKKCIEQWLYRHDHRGMRCPVCRQPTLPPVSARRVLRRSRRLAPHLEAGEPDVEPLDG